jgi:hypothetical protein
MREAADEPPSAAAGMRQCGRDKQQHGCRRSRNSAPPIYREE